MKEKFASIPLLTREKLIDRWHQIGFKPTSQRILIYEILAQSRDHPSAEEIYHEARKRYPALSLNTVYKTLEGLAAKGEVSMVNSDRTIARFEIVRRPHHHFHCRRCGTIIDIEMTGATGVSLPARYRKSLKLTGFQINFFGLCRSCQNSSGSQSRRESRH